MSSVEVPHVLLCRILEITAACLLLASLVLLVLGFVTKRGAVRRRLFVGSLASFLGGVASFVSGATLIYFVQIPRIAFVQMPRIASRVPYQSWNDCLSIAGPGCMLAGAGLLVWVVSRKRGHRKLILSCSLFFFALFLVASVLNYVLVYSIQDAAMTRTVLSDSGGLVVIGDRMPDVLFTRLDGTSVQLSQLRGKVVVLNFFATWCKPCQAELPHLEKLWRELHSDEDFAMLVVGCEESAKAVTRFRAENRFTFPMACDAKGKSFAQLANGGIPRTFLLSRDGTILYHSVGFSEAESVMGEFYEDELARLRTIIAAELKANP